jgi:hypothetical protein
MSDLVTVTVLILPFVFVILITWLQNIEKHKRQQLQADLYAKALEHGHALPANMFEDAKKKQEPLLIGTILVAVGIGISLIFVLMSIFFARTDSELSSILFSVSPVGIVPFLIGVAQLFFYFIEKKKGEGENAK